MAVLNGETGEWRTKHGIRIFVKDELTPTENQFKQKATDMYQNGKELLSQDATLLNDINWDSSADVEKKAVELVQKFNSGKPACFRVAGMIAAMFEHKNIPYEVHIGICIPSKIWKGRISISNHVWLKNTKNDKIYEHFPNYDSKNLLSHETKHMIKLAKRKSPAVSKAVFKKGAKQ